MAGFITKVALVTISDGDRSLVVNKGTHVEAHPDFFKRYGNDMVVPKAAFNPKLDFKMVIEDWRPEPVADTEKKEPEAPAPASDEKAADESKPAADEKAKDEAPAMKTSAPLTGKASKKGK